jgi:type I restriction enzyme S subunit
VLIGDALNLINGRAFKPTEWSKSGLPIIRIQNLNNAEAPFNYCADKLPEKFLVEEGDLLFAWSGTPGTSFGAHIWQGGRAWLNQHIFKVEFDKKQFNKRFLQLAINQNLAEYIRAAHGAAGLAHITKGRFESSELPVPLLTKQREIVAEIEKQFTRLEAGVGALRRVQANLKRYRASVLKAACEGRLVPTEAELARSEGHSYESADQLLARILVERRQKWSGRGKYKEPASSVSGLPPLPHGWIWTTLDSILREPLRNGHSAKAVAGGTGLRTFTLSSVTYGDFSERNTKLTRATADKVENLWAEPGDIYVERSNTPELVGISRLYRGPRHFAFIPDLLIRVRLQREISERYVEICLLSNRGRQFFRSRAQGISGTMPKIDQETIENAPIPLPPLREQKRIVAEVDRRLSAVDQLEAVVTANLRRATRLRQSILQKAFSPDGCPA